MEFSHSLREALKKNTIDSLTAVIPTLDPPLSLTAVGFFFPGGSVFVDRVVETDFVKILTYFDHKKRTNSWTTFDINEVRSGQVR